MHSYTLNAEHPVHCDIKYPGNELVEAGEHGRSYLHSYVNRELSSMPRVRNGGALVGLWEEEEEEEVGIDFSLMRNLMTVSARLYELRTIAASLIWVSGRICIESEGSYSMPGH